MTIKLRMVPIRARAIFINLVYKIFPIFRSYEVTELRHEYKGVDVTVIHYLPKWEGVGYLVFEIKDGTVTTRYSCNGNYKKPVYDRRGIVRLYDSVRYWITHKIER